ncbi:uncharacterized protein A1O9_08294 [Exophiala aquamarina CBS 119918]|uniref:Argonaute complex, subunit Arb1 n=1 Tax=Exophiala aquamarina CBS 119918 TaxID=1182545 RepID=A0A072P604_9EURO|nr:uncharacterized protein A1O9_08294 [Exophiala aquamarina CBS 119918]KEF55544.1 hypothetical protein A1O9_08294 [Exophiala aquamarina CBS 119918]
MANSPEKVRTSPESHEKSNGCLDHKILQAGTHTYSDLNQESIPLRTQPTTNSSSDGNRTVSEPPVTSPSEIHGNTSHDRDNDSTLEGDYGEVTNLPSPVDMAKKKKKKKKSKPASQRGNDKPTGFEDFFADAPLTPDQHAEERELYDPELHFIDRILTAIGRFERTRKMTPERRDVLFKYLSYGGVECGPNMFQGDQDLAQMDKTTIANILSNASITEEKRNLGTETSTYVVDFLGCMKGFLSRRAARLYGLDERAKLDMVTSTLERFMNYLLQHDVCPEYGAEILETRNFCRYDANAELWNVAEATRRLPGDFNTACSTLFGGQYAENYDGDTWWGPEHITDSVFVGIKPEEAHQILHFGVAGAATEDVFALYLEAVNGATTLEVVSVKERTGLEITRVEPPTLECTELYTHNSSHFRPVGRVYAKPWKNPDAPPEDLTDEEKLEEHENKSTGGKPEEEKEYLFFIESIIQEDLRVGMKLEATVRTLNCGLMFFDEFLTLYPSFDAYLPNEAMVGWKKPRPLKGAFDYVEGEEDVEDCDDGGASIGENAANDVAQHVNRETGTNGDASP